MAQKRDGYMLARTLYWVPLPSDCKHDQYLETYEKLRFRLPSNRGALTIG